MEVIVINRKLSLAPGRVLNVFTAIVGLGLLIALAFSLNVLFASRTSQTIRQPHLIAPNQQFLLDTKGWPTYTSSQYRFSMKYPPTWSVRELPNDLFVYFSHPKPRYEQVIVRVFPKPNALPLEKWLDQEISQSPKADSSIVKTPTQIGTFSALRVEGLPTGPLGGLNYYVGLGDRAVMISGGPYFPSKDAEQSGNLNPREEEVHRILQAMLSTLTKN